MANKLWWFIAGALALIIVGFFGPKRFPALRVWASWIAVVINVIAVGWVSLTAHLGGTLVYEHGVGTRAAGQTVDNPVTPSTMPATNHEHDHDREPTSASNAQTAPDHRETDMPVSQSQAQFFLDEVWPILEARCIKCHNPARVAANKSGRLDQSSLEGLLKGGRSGPAIVPGNPQESLLIQRVRGLVPDEDLMPPPPADPLTEQQIVTIEQWIREGAARDR